MTSANFHLVDQETGRGALHGIDYGPRWLVLIRHGEKLLLWVPGHSAWNGTGQAWRYAAATLYISDPKRHGGYRQLGTGGRLKAMLATKAGGIDAEFGEGVSKLLDPKRTLVL